MSTGSWRCGICGAPLEGDAAVMMRIQRHLQAVHDWPDVSDRWRLARNAVWIETTDAPGYSTTALIPKPTR